MYWTSGSGEIELNITNKIAKLCSHQGQCDDDVRRCLELPEIKKQFNKIDNITMAIVLKEYGAWDEKELQDIEANKNRILWIAAGDILEKKS